MFSNKEFKVPLGTALRMTFTSSLVQDITGWDLRLIVVLDKEQRYPILLQKAATITNAVLGKFEAVITHSEMLVIGAGRCYFSIFKMNSGSEDEIASGSIDVLPTATRF